MRQFTAPEGWAILGAFWLLFLAVVAFSSRKHDHTSAGGFLAASRGLGWVPSGLSIAATWIWAPALFVAAQQGYQHGWVGIFWFTVPNVACLALFAWFAARAREMFPEGLTLSAAAREKYSRRVQIMYLVGLIGLSIASFSVQLLAGGLVVTVLTGIPYVAVVLALSVMALTYTLWTGLRGSVVTDWLQMAMILVVGIGMALAVAFLAGGSTLADGLGGKSGTYTSLVSGDGAALFWSFGLSTTIGLLSGPFGDQSFWHRAWATKAGEVKKAFYLGATVFAVVPLCMGLLGLAAAGAHIKVSNAQLTNLTAILHWLPGWTAVPFLAYVLAGLVSTLSSQLAAVSTFAGYDLSSKRAVMYARVSMLALAVLAAGIALVPGIKIVQLFIFYGTLRACTLVPTVWMLLSKKQPPERGAFYGVVAALLLALPLSAYGNLTGTVWAIVAGSLVAIGVPALSMAADRSKRA